MSQQDVRTAVLVTVSLELVVVGSDSIGAEKDHRIGIGIRPD